MNTHAFKRSVQLIVIAACLLTAGISAIAQTHIKPPFTKKEWSRDYRPFRIAGNLYYVGTYDLACYLITSPQGHILINTGMAGSEPMIRKHIEMLGFRFADIKVLLATHAHFDHVGAMAQIKKLTGAKLMVNQNEAEVLADGGSSDYAFPGKKPVFDPVKPDVLLHNVDTINFGGMQVVALHHPGHTKGSTSFLFDVQDENRSYRVLIANMPSVIVPKLSAVTAYPNIIKDYAYTFDALSKLKFDIWLSSHASQFNLQAKHPPGNGYHPEAFFDRPGYDMELNYLKQDYLKNIGNN